MQEIIPRRYGYVGIAFALALPILLSGCEGRLLTPEQEIQIGREAAVDFERQYGGRSTDTRLVRLTQAIGKRIARAASRAPYYAYPYEFRVLNNREVNANAFPGGIIYLWRGLFAALDNNEEQLAWVAGHEAAHVARRHATKRIEQQLGYSLVIELLLGEKGGQQAEIARAIAGLTLQAYSRDQELEADRLGALFAYQAGYDPTASLAVLETFKRLQGREPSDLEIFFASHPGNTTREDHLKAYFRQQGWSGRYFRP